MSTESAPAPQGNVSDEQRPRIAVSALTTNLREYGLIIALIVIMLFFQFTTSGTLFKPVNLSNLVQQNSFIIVISSEMPELLGITDRIYVMNEGRMVGETAAADASQEKIMRAIVRAEGKAAS